jgi:hypothetical protein
MSFCKKVLQLGLLKTRMKYGLERQLKIMIYSVGHSTLEEGAFLALLRPLDVLVDVRSHPSSKWPQHRKESLEKTLPANNIEYIWEPDLGGWTEKYLHHKEWAVPMGVDVDVYARGKFPRQRIAADTGQRGISWWNIGLYDYSVFMMTPEFLRAADLLLEQGKTKNIGILCAEATWWRCHRSMIADYLYYRGTVVQHLLGKRASPHPIGNRLERYHPDIKKTWDEYVRRQTQ